MNEHLSLKAALTFAYRQYRNHFLLFPSLSIVFALLVAGFNYFYTFYVLPENPLSWGQTQYLSYFVYSHLLLLFLPIFYYFIVKLGFDALSEKPLSLFTISKNPLPFLRFIMARSWLLFKIVVFTLPIDLFCRYISYFSSPQVLGQGYYFLRDTLPTMSHFIAFNLALVYVFSGFFIADETTDSVWQDAHWNRYFTLRGIGKTLVLFLSVNLVRSAIFIPWAAPIYTLSNFFIRALGAFLVLTFLYLAQAHFFKQLVKYTMKQAVPRKTVSLIENPRTGIKTLSIPDALTFGVKQYSVLLFVTSLLAIVSFTLVFALGALLNVLPELVPYWVANKVPFYWSFFSITKGLSYFLFMLYVFMYFFYDYQIVRIGIAIYEGKSVTTQDLFTFDPEHFVQYSLAVALFWLKVILGLFLGIVGAFYFGAKYFFSGYSIADEKTLQICEDSAFSSELTNGVKWSVVLFFVVTAILSLFAYSFVITIPLLPVLILAKVHAYKQLAEYRASREKSEISLTKE